MTFFFFLGQVAEEKLVINWCDAEKGIRKGTVLIIDMVEEILYVMSSVKQQQFISFSLNAEIVVKPFAPAMMGKPHQCILRIMWMFFPLSL